VGRKGGNDAEVGGNNGEPRLNPSGIRFRHSVHRDARWERWHVGASTNGDRPLDC
jgi:hypothetical protein